MFIGWSEALLAALPDREGEAPVLQNGRWGEFQRSDLQHENDSSSVRRLRTNRLGCLWNERRGALAIRRDARAAAGKRTTRVESTRSTRRRRIPRMPV